MEGSNANSRLEAFCDGVFAMALTLLIISIAVPSRELINTTNDLWLSLRDLLPALFAFLLSFGIILITWVNHHAILRLVNRSSPSFIYANGFLLLTIVFIPFATALLGEYLNTDHAAPAVVLYTAVDALQAIGWIFVTRTALKSNLLTENEMSTRLMRRSYRSGYFAFAVYTICAIIAFWFPLPIALLISVMWLGWLIYSINIKSE